MAELEKGKYANKSETITIRLTGVDTSSGKLKGKYHATESLRGEIRGDLVGVNQYWSVAKGETYNILINYRWFGNPEGETDRDKRNFGHFVSLVGYFVLNKATKKYDTLHLGGGESYVSDPSDPKPPGYRSIAEEEFTLQPS